MMCIVERQESPATEPRITLGSKSKNCRIPILDLVQFLCLFPKKVKAEAIPDFPPCLQKQAYASPNMAGHASCLPDIFWENVFCRPYIPSFCCDLSKRLMYREEHA